MLRSRHLEAAALALILAGSISTLCAEPELRAQEPPSGFTSRMLREARRELGRSVSPLAIHEDIIDQEESEARSRQAERILRRSVRGALGERLEPILQALPAFELFAKRRGQGIGDGSPAGGITPDVVPSGPAGRPRDQVFDGSLGFRLDAHPRLILRGRLYGARGVLEVPVLDREIRLSIDQPIGTLGTAALRGGVSRERGEWLSLSINLSF